MATRVITPTVARRLAISRQRLAGPRPEPTSEGIMYVARGLGCLQLDPISVVARNHLLVLFSRLGPFDPKALDALLWDEYTLFEYWAHAASIVLTEDYPIHSHFMRRYLSSDSAWSKRTRSWLEENRELRDAILATIRREGPMQSKDFEDNSRRDWYSMGWTGGRNVSMMLDILWTQGKLMVCGRTGGQRLWDLSERILPEWTPREMLDQREVVRRSVEKSLRALGVARSRDIKLHFTRNRYDGLEQTLSDLVAEGLVERVEVAEPGRSLPGAWYVHTEDLPLLERLEAGDWEPRTTLLSPFDNLICDRARTELLFDFEFRIEIYTPKEKRKYGYYVLSILHGDRLVGRIDSVVDRKQKVLNVNAVYAEPHATGSEGEVNGISGALEELATFTGAKEIAFLGEMPEVWRDALSSAA